ncbi:hypothetical protein M0R45_027280 [Rubus argutus]|uniref:Uncharacterized protein n=1 Tax=Rubus argutus TaxID=59490 RepID=A0AAW1X2L2_RUBAR
MVQQLEPLSKVFRSKISHVLASIVASRAVEPCSYTSHGCWTNIHKFGIKICIKHDVTSFNIAENYLTLRVLVCKHRCNSKSDIKSLFPVSTTAELKLLWWTLVRLPWA